MRLAIRHVTHYSFTEPVHHGLQRLRLRPKATNGQTVLDWTMELDGATEQVSYEDQHHNHVTLVSIPQGTSEVCVTISGTVETADTAGVIGQHAGYLPLWHFAQPTALTRGGPAMQALVAKAGQNDGDTIGWLHRLSAAISGVVQYGKGMTDATTSAEQALMAGHGVCQDHVHIFLGCCCLAGIPARYVSGYLMMDDRVDQEAGHAWAEAHVAGLGWVGFDISNGISPDPRYVRVATGRDYREAAPVTGMVYGAQESALRITLSVEQQQANQ